MRTIVRSIATLARDRGPRLPAAAAAPTPATTRRRQRRPLPRRRRRRPIRPAPRLPTPTAVPSVGPMDPAHVTGTATGGSTMSEGTTDRTGGLASLEGVVLEYIRVC